MNSLKPARALALAAIATAALSQPVLPSATPAMVPRTSASAAWQSAFGNYRPFTDAEVLPWRQTNEAVGRIGGWRAYAAEVQSRTAPSAVPAEVPSSGAASSAGDQHQKEAK